MGFDTKKFSKTKFVPRVEAVEVPDLRDFFPEGESPIWKVRGLTGQEMGRANEAASRNKNVLAVIAAMVGDEDSEKISALAEMLGTTDSATEDVAKRIAYLAAGSVDPVCSEDIAVRMCEVFPIEFYQLSTKILQLTGMGQEPGKSKPSGNEEKSEQASHSAIPEGGSSTKQGRTSSRKGSSRKQK